MCGGGVGARVVSFGVTVFANLVLSIRYAAGTNASDCKLGSVATGVHALTVEQTKFADKNTAF